MHLMQDQSFLVINSTLVPTGWWKYATASHSCRVLPFHGNSENSMLWNAIHKMKQQTLCTILWSWDELTPPKGNKRWQNHQHHNISNPTPARCSHGSNVTSECNSCHSTEEKNGKLDLHNLLAVSSMPKQRQQSRWQSAPLWSRSGRVGNGEWMLLCKLQCAGS